MPRYVSRFGVEYLVVAGYDAAMQSMRAVVIQEPGPESKLTIETRTIEPPSPHHVQVRVSAAGLNRADLLQRAGFYPAPPGVAEDIPGLEFAGTISAVGDGVSESVIGERVMGIVAGGGMATHVNVPRAHCMPIPDNLSEREAAALPEIYLTAYDALVGCGGLKPGERVLVHAAASGVGTAAIQLASRLGAQVVGTTRSEEKLHRIRDLGAIAAHRVIDGKFAAAVGDVDGGGMDLILDFVGAAYLRENLKALASRGRLVVIGLLGGAKGELPLGLLLQKRASVIGTVLRSRSDEEKSALTAAFWSRFGAEVEAGSLRPVIADILPMQRIAEAHESMARNETVGKLVMHWED